MNYPNSPKSGISHRGITDGNEEIHLKIEKRRPGMKEGIDYHFKTACMTGAFHIRHTLAHSKVTCPRCLAAMK